MRESTYTQKGSSFFRHLTHLYLTNTSGGTHTVDASHTEGNNYITEQEERETDRLPCCSNKYHLPHANLHTEKTALSPDKRETVDNPIGLIRGPWAIYLVPPWGCSWLPLAAPLQVSTRGIQLRALDLQNLKAVGIVAPSHTSGCTSDAEASGSSGGGGHPEGHQGAPQAAG